MAETKSHRRWDRWNWLCLGIWIAASVLGSYAIYYQRSEAYWDCCPVVIDEMQWRRDNGMAAE